MIQINRQSLLISFLIGLFFSATGGCSLADKQQADAVDVSNAPLQAAVAAAVPGFPEQVSGISGDFDENGFYDKAVLVSSGRQWRLAVLFQQSNGQYDVARVSTFPDIDDDWYAIPISRLQLFLVTSDESPTDRIGLQVIGQESSLEFFWHENTDDFIASRVHNRATAEKPDNTIAQNRGESMLQAVDATTDGHRVADIDLDPQSDVSSAVADLKFTVAGGSMVFYTLDPIGEAVAVPYGKSAPTYKDCLGAVESMSNDNMPEVVQGMYFCTKTDQDMLASVWVQSLDAASNRLLLGYQRWPKEKGAANARSVD